MSSILLRVPHHPYRWLQLLALQQLLLGVAMWSADPRAWIIAVITFLPVLALRWRPPEHRLRLHPEERAITVGGKRISLLRACGVQVSLGLYSRLAIYDAFGNRILTLRGLSLPHAKWAARQLGEHFRLPVESMEDTASAPQAPLADGFLEKVLEVPMFRDLLARIAPALALFGFWVSRPDTIPWAPMAGVFCGLLVLGLGLVGAKRRQRVRFTADRVEVASTDLLGRSETKVLRAEDLLPAHVLPGVGAVPTLILADHQGQRVDLAGIQREDLLEVAACIEQMRGSTDAIPEPKPEPPELHRLRRARVLE